MKIDLYAAHPLAANAGLHLLRDIRVALSIASDPEAALVHIVQQIVPAFADVCAIYMADSDEALRMAAFELTERIEPVHAETSALVRALLAQSASVMQTGHAALLPELDALNTALGHAASADSFRFLSALCVPLIARQRPFGALIVLSAPGQRYGPGDLELAEELAHCIAIRIDQTRMLDEQRHAADLLELQAQTLTAVVQALPVASAIYSPDYRCQRHNAAFATVARRQEGQPNTLVGLSLRELFESPIYDVLQIGFERSIATGEVWICPDLALMRLDGQIARFAWRLMPLYDSRGVLLSVLVTVTDITAQKRAEEERADFERKLMAGQKLESLGVLAGGIAHDLNNILTIAQGNVELALMDLSDTDHLLTKYLTTVEIATHRATDLAHQMLAYSSKHHFASCPIQLNDLIEEMAELLHTSISKQIVVEYQLAATLPAVEVNVTQIRQVMMNLIINAVDAIGPNRGTIRVHTGMLAADDPFMTDVRANKAAAYAFVEVSDTGCGMTAATLNTIFEPFFTTKSAGCGLGLAAVQGIIQAHQGLILVDSAVGEGTTFRILLPCTAQRQAAATSPNQPAPWHGSGTVMVVDDELFVRLTIGKMLEKLGFKVLFAGSGLEGLRVVASNAAISLVLLDVTMPGLNGYETLMLIRQRAHGLPVVLMSGSSVTEVDRDQYEALAPVRLLQKPLSFADLRSMLAEFLPLM